ncbi:Signal transduction histidine kinase [Nannocystis exedens]|uniref:histidine kinase n=1 Tax=Nannocystis exedens TaxID=54 RepID=A0A1I2CRM5_9BACT|nr:response regulator [Nannocystis exedens]PCC68509.1 hybrid sensor histidine kinase/response regulator [Nannocystis exedens]SFE70874.1 Signal transduction histidine kinase [Nannocystis exedens]
MHEPVDVLIVDDDEDDFVLARELIADITTSDYRVRWVQSYQDAVHALLTAAPDVCLLDYRLEARTGIDLLREVRGLGCDVPIIFLTGQTERELDVEAMHAGADDFLIKGSFTTRELERAIRYAIERAATGAAQRRLTEELRLMQVQAQRSSQAKSTFLANMSHEFRTPLNAILGYSDMLIDQARAGEFEQIEDDLNRIRAAGNHLLALVTDILDLSRIEAGRLSLAPERYRLGELLREVVDAVAPLIHRNGNRFVYAPADELGEMVADATRTRQILFNLLSNAGKFTRKGVVSLAVTRRPARLSDFNHHAGDQPIEGVECVEFVVADSGIGMTPKQMERLFEPFSQVDDTGGRRFGGSGLGLAISRRLARAMGGELRARSEIGRGSSFRLSLPSDSTAAARWRGLTPERQFATRDRGQLPIVFVLGPTDAFGRQLRDQLADVQLDIVVEADLRRGVKLARALGPSLLVVELNVGAPATLVTLGQLAREPSLQEAGLLVYLVDEQAQFGCLLASDGVVSAPLQALQLQRIVERLSPGTGQPLHLWSNSAGLLQEATEMIRHTRRLAAAGGGGVDLSELHLVHLAAPGASWGLAAGRSDERAGRPAVVLVAPDDPRAVPPSFAAEMRALVEQAGIPRQELAREVSAALVARMRHD